MIWDELTSAELGACSRSTPVFLPVAATEQHGPHLPLATDRLIVEHFMTRLSDVLENSVLILPTVAVGCSQHHLSFPGTLSVRHDTLLRQLEDILVAVTTYGFTNLVLLNSHGGNSATVQVSLEAFGAAHPDCRIIATSWWQVASKDLEEITETGLGGVGHACEFETSLLLHFAPERVRHDAIPAGGNRPTFPWAEGDMLRKAPASFYRDFKAMTLNGVFGDPTAASAEKGRAIEFAVLAALTELVTTLSSKPRATFIGRNTLGD